MSDRITIPIDTKTLGGYNMFIKCKKLPVYQVVGNNVVTDEKSYNYVFSGDHQFSIKHCHHSIEFDYQKYVINRALEREKYAAFLDCGLGKTIIYILYVYDVINYVGGKALIMCPLSVLNDFQREHERIMGFKMSNLRCEKWITDVAIDNYEGMRPHDMKNVTCLVLDESSILKSGTGETARYLNQLAANVKFRLAGSATPSPNDQTEYASHAVFLGISNTQKEFYSKFFVKDGTEWRMKHHAKDAFYDFLKSWACYIHSPSSLGFEQGAELKDPPEYIIQESYPVGDYYQEGNCLATSVGFKGSTKIFTNLRCDKTQDRFKQAVDAIHDKRFIVWTNRNKEEDTFSKYLGVPAINGSTPLEKRIELVDAFKSGQIPGLVSKPSVLGFGVNIQEAEVHLYSGYNFSFEEFYQAPRRSHRYGRVGRLKVIVPVSEPERPIWESLKRKLDTFNDDVSELQKRFF